MLHRQDRKFEQSVNIDATGTLQTEEATIPRGSAADGSWYGPVSMRVVRWLMSEMPAELDGFAFVDLGSGKGRVLFAAAERGFARVIGVEYALELHQAAEENIRQSTLPEKRRIELVLGDAGAYEFPPEPLVVYICNSFNEKIMARVIDNLTRSYQEHPRPLIVIYEQHRHEPPRTKYENVQLLASVPFLHHRSLEKTSLLDRAWLLSPFLVDIFESPEARGLASGTKEQSDFTRRFQRAADRRSIRAGTPRG